MNPLAPRPINPTDDTATFDCGNEALNMWLSQRALVSERVGDARTYVSTDANTGLIAGLYAISAWSMDRRVIHGFLARNAPQAVSVILLGRLATSLDARGIGLGKDLLAHAIRQATIAADALGARALVTEAKDASATSFYEHMGMKPVIGQAGTFAIRMLASSTDFPNQNDVDPFVGNSGGQCVKPPSFA